MARRRRQSNPGGHGIGMLLLLGGAAYVAYEYLLAPQANVLSGAAPSTSLPTTSIAPLPLGTTVTNSAQLTLQVHANYPYIIYGGDLTTAAPPDGYQLVNTSDKGNIWARNDVAAIAQLYGVQVAQIQSAMSLSTPGGYSAQVLPPLSLLLLQSFINNPASIPTSPGVTGLSGLNPMYAGAWG